MKQRLLLLLFLLAGLSRCWLLLLAGLSWCWWLVLSVVRNGCYIVSCPGYPPVRSRRATSGCPTLLATSSQQWYSPGAAAPRVCSSRRAWGRKGQHAAGWQPAGHHRANGGPRVQRCALWIGLVAGRACPGRAAQSRNRYATPLYHMWCVHASPAIMPSGRRLRLGHWACYRPDSHEIQCSQSV